MATARTSTPPGTPLPDGHPFKNGCVIFGMKRPGASRTPSAPPADPHEIEAHRGMEDSLHLLYEQHTGLPWTEESSSSESTTPDSPESAST